MPRGNLPKRAGLAVVLPMPTRPDVPSATPDEWLESTRADWECYWAGPLAQLTTADDVPAVRRLFDLRDQRDRATAAYVAEPFVVGSTGQPTVSPAGKRASQLEPLITALEDRFGLSPMARLRLGVELGRAVRSLDALNEAVAVKARRDPRG